MILESLLNVLENGTAICTNNESFPKKLRGLWIKEDLMHNLSTEEYKDSVLISIVESIILDYIDNMTIMNITIKENNARMCTLGDLIEDLFFNEDLYINTNNESFPEKYRGIYLTFANLYENIIKQNDKEFLKNKVRVECDYIDSDIYPEFATNITLTIVK